MEDFVPFGGREYLICFSLLMFGRGLDFLSTWIATPNLLLEANPIARKLGWRWGAALNLLIVGGFAMWPLPALVITTTSMLVASRNFQSAWLMKTLGEYSYRSWMGDRFAECGRGLFAICILAQTGIFALIGAALVLASGLRLVPFGIGMGMITYAVAVAFYTFLAAIRYRRNLH